MGKFQRRHYEILAATIALFDENQLYEVDDIINKVSDMLIADNHKFKYNQFVEKIDFIRNRFVPRYD